jgi:hypothetical protein
MVIRTFVVDGPPIKPESFKSEVVRVEADGFGIIKFDTAIGPNANTFGIVTSSTTTISPFTSLRAGVRVEGTAYADDRDVASIKEFKIVSPWA